MTYRAPIPDILHTMRMAAGARGHVPAELDDGTAEAVLTEADRFAREVLLPLDAVGDRTGLRLDAGAVTTPAGWRDAYRAFCAAGWAGLAAPPAYGGQGLSALLAAGVAEIWHGANLAFALCPLLNAGAVEAIAAHATPELKARYLPRLVSGAWTGTMNLTEPQAGSDLGALRTRAEPAGEGRYRITGSKIYISYGEHDLAENIVHLVLARLPDAPAGSRGISLFLVPKYVPEEDGTPGHRNALLCTGLERKLGMHAAPTCSMSFEGADGFLVGEANRGLAAMFTMMNRARLAVGLEGVGAAERASQNALRFARERRQGRAPGWTGDGPSPIVEHPDVARMCLTARALAAGARALCYLTAQALDEAKHAADDAARREAAETAALLTPVAKAFSTDVANEVASLNIQVHGGAGYIEDAGAARIARDARILSIYEGTNGIQAADLVLRKIGPLGGSAYERELAAMRAAQERLRESNDPRFGQSAARLADARDALDRATVFLRDILPRDGARALAGATSYLRLFALTRGGAALADEALASGEPARIGLCRFFAEQLLPAAPGLATTVVDGAEDVGRWRDLLAAE